MKRQLLERQIQEFAEIINHLEEGDIDVESLMGLDELLDLLSNKIKSTRFGNPLLRQSSVLEAVKHEAIFIFDCSFKVYKYAGIFDHLFYPERQSTLMVPDLIRFEDEKILKSNVELLLSTKENQDFETVIESSQGIPLSVSVSLELLPSKTGNELIMAGVNFSNTTMSDIKNYQQIVIENLPDIDVYLFDSDYRYVLSGGREKERFGLTNGFFPGKTLFEAFDDKVSKRLFPFYRKAMSGEMAEGEFRYKDQIYYIWANPVRNYYDEVVGGTAIVQNVTRDKEIEVRLKKARDDAQRADQAKSIFLANMSHEIRTPLNAIIGFSEQLQNTKLNKRQDKFANFISDSSEHLLSLVNEILILFKLGMGKVFIDKVPFNLTQVLNVIYNSFIIKANEKSVKLTVQIDPDIPETLIGDPFRLRQILINLISNALNFTDEGRVTIRCVLTKKYQKTFHLQFAVEDSGLGIDAGMIDTIFDEFTQSTIQIDKKRKGVGLGLTISKKIVELMGGSIQVESELGKGSLFTFDVPFQKASEKEKAERESNYSLNENLLKGKRILFADDDEYNLLLAEAVLSNWDADFKLARNGEEALNLSKKKKYDILLLDIHMPKMSGLELVHEIRNTPLNPNYTTKMLAVTANVIKGDVRKYMGQGFNGYVLKPFKEKELYNKVCNVLQLTNLKTMPDTNLIPEIGTANNENTFDQENLYLTSNGDHAFFNKMIDTFIRNSGNLIVDFEAALKKDDWNDVGEKAHRAIPSFKYFGLNELVERLSELEDLALRDKQYLGITQKTKELFSLIEAAVLQAKQAKLKE